ncbi:MAG: hypothetical protein WEC16_01580 [Anaerolineales bacterium]
MTKEFKVEGLCLDLGVYSDALQKLVDKATENKLVGRIWRRDHTVWKPQPTEISSRLGWLDIATRMKSEIPMLDEFAHEVKQAGISKVLLLGMGGSSLAPELFAKVFGGKKSGLELHVLDSTDPQAVLAKAASHPPKRTLYIVSSKSGGTVETFSFFKYFYNLAAADLGADAGSHFVAITDPGSGLAQTAAEHTFRRTFLADPDIGGRYSALTHFGLVPAALIGVDLNVLLASAESMALRCQNENLAENPGALLGLALGCLAAQGRDKATFALPIRSSSFGDWAEQLIAESTGKEGRGILPVTGEPPLQPGDYGLDRVFVNMGARTVANGRPRISIDWGDAELGGLFFLWEFAIAVAGHMLGINPFDQPDVEAAKVTSRHFMDEYKKTAKLPQGKDETLSPRTLTKFLGKASPGDYIALQTYAAPSERLTRSLQELRGQLAGNHKVATTLGYGPRFLHSTGQLHKGDSGKGLFVQFVTVPSQGDLPIPTEAGRPASEIGFGVLKLAQARGDAEALSAAGRRVISFEIQGDLADALDTLSTEQLGKHV